MRMCERVYVPVFMGVYVSAYMGGCCVCACALIALSAEQTLLENFFFLFPNLHSCGILQPYS